MFVLFFVFREEGAWYMYQSQGIASLSDRTLGNIGPSRVSCSTEIDVFLKYREKLYFLKYFYQIWLLHWLRLRNEFFQKYNWEYNLCALLGTVIKCPNAVGSAWEENTMESCVLLQAIYFKCADIWSLFFFPWKIWYGQKLQFEDVKKMLYAMGKYLSKMAKFIIKITTS